MNLIVAVDKNWGIGRDNELLTYIPSDLRYFKEHTLDKVIVMGRKTLESLPGSKGLPKRTNIVLTTRQGYEAERAIIVNSEEELFEELNKYDPDDVFITGGASLYNKYYPMCDKLYITKMDADLKADTFIANIDADENFRIASESEPITENGITYRWLVYEKK